MTSPLPTVIGLAGSIASGKSSLAHYIEQKFDFINLRYSLLIRRELERQGTPVNEDNLLRYGQELGERLGPMGVSALLMADYTEGSRYVIDGVRHIEEVTYFRERFNNKFTLIYIIVPEDVRYERFTKRGGERATSKESFIERSQHLMESEVPSLQSLADIIINNNSLEDMKERIDQLLCSK